MIDRRLCARVVFRCSILPAQANAQEIAKKLFDGSSEATSDFKIEIYRQRPAIRIVDVKVFRVCHI